MLFISIGVNSQVETEIPLYPDDPVFIPENRDEKIEYDTDGLRNVVGKVVPMLTVF